MTASNIIVELTRIIEAPQREQLLMIIELRQQLIEYRKQVERKLANATSNPKSGDGG